MSGLDWFGPAWVAGMLLLLAWQRRAAIARGLRRFHRGMMAGDGYFWLIVLVGVFGSMAGFALGMVWFVDSVATGLGAP